MTRNGDARPHRWAYTVRDAVSREEPMISRYRCRAAAGPAVTVVALVALVTACGGSDDSEAERSDTPSASPSPTERAAATPLGAGELIVFERFAPGGDERDLYVVGPDGGEPRLLRSPGEYPHWSPDGSQLAFLACLNPPDCTTGLALLERSTGEVHWFPMPDPDLFTACAIWAPSGRELACAGLSEGDPTRNGVYTIRASDGTGLTRITRNPGGEDYPLAYSPDGSQLLLDRMDPSRGGSANHALFVTPISGGQPHRITPWGFTDDYANWSPDGRTIVFETNGVLYRVSPEGQRLARIPLKPADRPTAEHAYDASFSPDGRRIVFSFASPEPGIYTARLDGSDVKRLTTTPTEDHHANWGAAPTP